MLWPELSADVVTLARVLLVVLGVGTDTLLDPWRSILTYCACLCCAVACLQTSAGVAEEWFRVESGERARVVVGMLLTWIASGLLLWTVRTWRKL